MKAVFFDLDDTLYAAPISQSNEVLIAYTARKYQLSVASVKAAFDHGKAVTKKLLGDVAATHNRLLYIQHMLEFLGKNAAADSLELYDVFWNHYLQVMKLRPGAADTLADLRRRSIPIGICTDLTAHIQHRKIQKLGIAADITWLVTSEEAGAEKPSSKIFQLCLSKSRLKSEDILYVGDNQKKDFWGASKAGMHAIWYREDLYSDFFDFYQKEMEAWILKK